MLSRQHRRLWIDATFLRSQLLLVGSHQSRVGSMCDVGGSGLRAVDVKGLNKAIHQNTPPMGA